MTPVRPSHVPEDATLIYPGQMFGPGEGEQKAAIIKDNALITRQNAAASDRYAGAYSDWAANAVQYTAYKMRVPPPPAAPLLERLEVVYANIAGEVNDTPAGADGLHYAWIWQVPASRGTLHSSRALAAHWAVSVVLVLMLACTPAQIQQTIGYIQSGMAAVSLILPALGSVSPTVTAPLTKYLTLAATAFGRVAEIVRNVGTMTHGEEAAAISAALSDLVAQDPQAFLPANASDELVARVKAIATSAKNISAMFVPTRIPGAAAGGTTKPQTVKLTSAQVQQLNEIQAHVQVALLALHQNP